MAGLRLRYQGTKIRHRIPSVRKIEAALSWAEQPQLIIRFSKEVAQNIVGSKHRATRMPRALPMMPRFHKDRGLKVHLVTNLCHVRSPQLSWETQEIQLLMGCKESCTSLLILLVILLAQEVIWFHLHKSTLLLLLTKLRPSIVPLNYQEMTLNLEFSRKPQVRWISLGITRHLNQRF